MKPTRRIVPETVTETPFSPVLKRLLGVLQEDHRRKILDALNEEAGERFQKNMEFDLARLMWKVPQNGNGHGVPR